VKSSPYLFAINDVLSHCVLAKSRRRSNSGFEEQSRRTTDNGRHQLLRSPASKPPFFDSEDSKFF
jgi:hypothetical protein